MCQSLATSRPSRHTLALLLLLGLVLCFLRVNHGGLANSDDAFYASAVRRADREATWLRYQWNDARLDFRYPPLHFLALRLSTSLIGHSTLGLRLPAALSAFLCLLLVAILVRRLGGDDVAALTAGLLCCASGVFFLSARSVRVDTTLAAASTATILSYVCAWSRPAWLPLTGVFAGLAILSKSVMGLLPLLPIGIDLLTTGRQMWRRKELYLGLGLFLLTAGSWHLWQVLRYGDEFIDTYLVYTVLQRLRGIVGLQKPEAIGLVLLRSEGLLLALWLATCVGLLFRCRADRGVRFVLLWSAAAVAPLIVSSTRLAHYLVPAVPALSIVVGLFVSQLRIGRLRFLLPIGALAIFIANNTATWLDPDFTPGLPAITGHAQRLMGTAGLVVFNDYHVAAEYYVDRPTALVTDDKRAFRLLTGERAMQEAAHVELIDPQAMPQRMAADRPLVWLTTTLFEKRLLAYAARLPPSRRGQLRQIRRGPYVLLFEQVPGSAVNSFNSEQRD